MTRTTHRHHLTLTRRPVERFGRTAEPVSTEVWIEAQVHGEPCREVGDAVDRLGRLLGASDLTGWFADPFAFDLARWLDGRLRPLALAAGRHLQCVAVETPDLRCEFDPH